MKSIRFIAVFLLSFTALMARADVNGSLHLVGGTTDSWVYTSPISGGTQTTLNFMPSHTEARLYTVIMALNVTSLSDSQRPVASLVTLDNAVMTFSSVVNASSATSYYTFLGLLSGPLHELVLDFSNKSFSSVGSYISVASAPMPTPPAPVPEPETWAMLLAGLGVLGHVARKRRASQPA
jgi:hypothetical protein